MPLTSFKDVKAERFLFHSDLDSKERFCEQQFLCLVTKCELHLCLAFDLKYSILILVTLPYLTLITRLFYLLLGKYSKTREAITYLCI